MSTHRRIDMICAAALIFTIVLTVLLMSGGMAGLMPVMSRAGSIYFTANDLDAGWDTASATKIELSDQGSTISGNGAYENDGDVYIAYAGSYVLTGELTDGSVVIDAQKSDQIRILLDGVTLYNDNGAAIRVEQADHVFLTLADGTKNVVSSGAQYDETLAASGVDGTIYSRDDLTINGTGELAVSGTYSHGIVCNDDLVITGGRLMIDAVQDGIHANDSVRIREAEISVSAGDDGITVSNDDETAFFYMESGSVSIPDCYEGIEAVDITIAGGTIEITPTDDGINANGSGEGSVIRITGGDIAIENPSGRDADGLDSNGSIYVEGGNLFISVVGTGGNSALDYGTENGGECIVNGGTVVACGGSMMAEGFDSSSGQGFLMYQTTAEEQTTVRLADSDGNELLSEEIPYSFSSVVLSTPGLKVGDVCTIAVGDTEEEVTIDNVPDSGFRPAGMPGMPGGGMRGGKDRFGQPDGNRDMGAAQDAETEEKSGETENTLPAGKMAKPDDASMPDGKNADSDEPKAFGGMERPDDMELPGKAESSGRTDFWEEGRNPMRSDEAAAASGISADRLVLVGISAAVLLAGFAFAAKIKH